MIIQCLLRNPLVLTEAICKVTESMTLKSSSYFLPKYLQSQYLIKSKLATRLTGFIIVPGVIIGRFLGGLIVDKLEISCKNKLKFILLTSIVSSVLFLLNFLWSVKHQNLLESMKIMMGCNAAKELNTEKEKTYYNCSCIKEGLTTPDADGQFIDATSGSGYISEESQHRILTVRLYGH
eukprot:XP_017452348.1 PREDICTED: solute carrier organic anion transporter family member 6A1-like isoform X1 [Rattus norvegicus]